MASEAFAGVGTKFQRWDGAAWQDIAEVNGIEGPGMTKDVLEVTSLDTDAGYNEFITGFAEGGTLTLDMNFTRETYELMKEDFESDEVRSYRIQLPDFDSEPSTFTIEGLVIELPITMSADDKVTADVVIQITSQVVLDIGSTVPAEESEIIPEESSEAPPEESSETPPASSEDEWPDMLDDGHTLALLEFESNVSVVSTDQVIQWLDRLNSGRGLFDAEESSGSRPQLTADGILFDGVGEVLKSGAWTWNQPATVYIVFRQITWTSNDRIFDGQNGANVDYGSLRQYSTTPRILPYAGAAVAYRDDLRLGSWGVVAVVFNGANSWMKINMHPAATGDFGTRNPSGFTLGGNNVFTQFANIEVRAVCCRDVADSEASFISTIFPYFNNKHVHTVVSASLEDATPDQVWMEFDEDLDTDSGTDFSAFSVGGRTVTGITIQTRRVVVQLNTAFAESDGNRAVSYAGSAASANPLMTAAGEEVPDIYLFVVTNNITD